MNTFGAASLLEKKRERTRHVLSEETFGNVGTRLKACPRKSLLREYGLVTGFVKQCALVKSIHRELILQLILHQRSCKYSKYRTLAVTQFQTNTLHDIKFILWCSVIATVGTVHTANN
jgi:hypothetical protein